MGWEGKTNFYRCSLQEARTGRIGFTWEAWFNFPILLLICRYPGVFRTCVNQHMCMKIATFRERYLPFQNRCTEDIHKSSPEVLLLLEEWNRQSVQTQVSHLEMSIVRWNEAYTILVFFSFFFVCHGDVSIWDAHLDSFHHSCAEGRTLKAWFILFQNQMPKKGEINCTFEELISH